MSSQSTNQVLNRLLTTINRSLPMYLVDACPCFSNGDQRLASVLNLIVEDYRATVERIGEAITANDGTVNLGHFPINFTRFNDLSAKFLLQELIASQVRDIVTIESCVDQLNLAPMAKALAQETLGAALGHLDSLREISTPAAAAV